MNKWEIRTNEGIDYITIPKWLNSGVNVMFSTRNGGVSQIPFDSLNLGLHVGDIKADVIENRQRLLNVYGGQVQDMVCCQQVHGSKVAIVNQKHKGCGALEINTALPGCDAMITDTPGVFLTTFYADCYPIYFFDPVRRIIGLAHSGWKGTVGRIAGETVNAMTSFFACQKENIEVFIGPGIRKCCFQIGVELVKKVRQEFCNPDQIIFADEKGFYWDLQKTNREILIDFGIKPENILCCDLCTSCNKNLFFSYRRDNGQTGRMGAVIGLNY